MPSLLINTFKTLDDLMRVVLEKLLSQDFDVDTTRGKVSEIIGINLVLDNPRARLSRTETKGKAFSALGELFWYLSGSNKLDFIRYYIKQYEDESEDGKTVYGGYGARIFRLRRRFNQFQNVVELLKVKPTSRRAVIQLFDGADLEGKHKEIPCTCVLQFLVRDEKLQMVTYMRSNDAFLGLPHDIFAFTMIQEIIARMLGREVGNYTHSVGSLHLYEKHKVDTLKYLSEGIQASKNSMPFMPEENPYPAIKKVLKYEKIIRSGLIEKIDFSDLPPYWADIIRLMAIYKLAKARKIEDAVRIQRQFHYKSYNIYIEKRLEKMLILQQETKIYDKESDKIVSG